MAWLILLALFLFGITVAGVAVGAILQGAGWLTFFVILFLVGKWLWNASLGGVNPQKAARLSKNKSSTELYEYLCRFSDAQHIRYIRGITDREELSKAFCTGAFGGYRSKSRSKTSHARAVALERLDNECRKCGSRERPALRTFTRDRKEHETRTRKGAKHHHYNADGDYKGYTEDEEEFVVEKTVTETFEERTCGRCGYVWHEKIT